MAEVIAIGAEGFTSPRTGLSAIKVVAAFALAETGRFGDREIAAALSCRVQDLARIPHWPAQITPPPGETPDPDGGACA